MKRSQFPCLLLVAALAMLSSCDNSSNSSKDETPPPGGSEGPATPASSYGIPWKSGITYGTLTDARDRKVYRTVKIGTQRWMAENLNYEVDRSRCYEGSVDSCAKYGRLYTWAPLMNLADTCNTKACASQVQSKHRGICPSGWHVPSDLEWGALLDAVGGSDSAGTKLKAASGWAEAGNGTDSYGFRTLPSGIHNGDSNSAGYSGLLWSATEDYWSHAKGPFMNYDITDVFRNSNFKTQGYAARCVED